MNRISRRRLALVLSAAALVLAGCGGGEAPIPPPTGLEKSTILVGAQPTSYPVALYIAQAEGFFREEGLTVQPVSITGADALSHVESGVLDLTQANYVSTFRAVTRGREVKVVADMYQAAPGTFALMVPQDSPIRTVANLKGRTILVNDLRNIATLGVTAQLRAAGLSEADVTFAEMPSPDIGEAVNAGQADAGLVVEPHITANKGALGFRVLADTMTGRTADLPIAGWVATDDWVLRHPKTMAAFQRAISKAQRLASGDRKVIEATLPTYTVIDAKMAAEIALGAYPSRLDPARLQKLADLMLEYKYLRRPIDVTSIIAPDAGVPSGTGPDGLADG
ncbi:ABC transporter substrate-binding protein [Nonomuraea sp. SYSU D8015]|uniref:ABC transporter substrate-binding protein n=1 Tax=Nonomuraea sp. SYSU D8015 TaxID=2593644 RepID=UPI001660ABB2|nr:ABC transporter substrate-binding protein [Nonomuraea sp. SYSU D8015]